MRGLGMVLFLLGLVAGCGGSAVALLVGLITPADLAKATAAVWVAVIAGEALALVATIRRPAADEGLTMKRGTRLG